MVPCRVHNKTGNNREDYLSRAALLLSTNSADEGSASFPTFTLVIPFTKQDDSVKLVCMSGEKREFFVVQNPRYPECSSPVVEEQCIRSAHVFRRVSRRDPENR